MLKWLWRAEGDLEEIETYIAQDNTKAAVDMVVKIIWLNVLSISQGLVKLDVWRGQKSWLLMGHRTSSRIVKKGSELKF